MGSSPVVGSSKKMISGSEGDGPRQADALLHAARELRRHQVGDFRLQPDLAELLDREVVRVGAVELVHARGGEGDVAPDRQRVEQRAALEQHAAAAQERLAGAEGKIGHVLAVDQHRGRRSGG